MAKVTKERFYGLNDTTILRVATDENDYFCGDLICLATNRVISSMKFSFLTELFENMVKDDWFVKTETIKLFYVYRDCLRAFDNQLTTSD